MISKNEKRRIMQKKMQINKNEVKEGMHRENRIENEGRQEKNRTKGKGE